MSKPGITKRKFMAKLSQLSLYPRSKKNKINNVSGDNNNNSNERKHDVFLSFRGVDTRNNFTDHLYSALHQKSIQTFRDDVQLTRGQEIPSSLLRATSESKISIVIFSENYASSGWCLRELAEIMKNKRMYGQIVIPVFYRVDRSHVREQTGSFTDSFAQHEQVLPQQELQVWRDALTEASNLPGWDLSGNKSEADLVKSIVEDVLHRLPLISDSKGPTGSRGGGGDGEGGSGGVADGDNDGGDNTEGGGGGGGEMGFGEMGPETGPKVEPDFRDFRNNSGDENGYPVGQLHRRKPRNYQKPYVCSIIPYEKNILMATAVVAVAAAEAAAFVMVASAMMAGDGNNDGGDKTEGGGSRKMGAQMKPMDNGEAKKILVMGGPNKTIY